MIFIFSFTQNKNEKKLKINDSHSVKLMEGLKMEQQQQKTGVKG